MPPWLEVESAIRSVRSIANDLTLVVVANLKPTGRLEIDYSGTSIATEYFSESEAAQVMIAFQENGFYTKFYNGELALITAALDGEFDRAATHA